MRPMQPSALHAPHPSSTFAAAPPARAQEAPLRDRWVYVQTNLLVAANLDKLEPVLRRASKAGYNGILLADSKFSRLADMDERYFQNVARLKALCRELSLEAFPAVFPIGYSEGLLSRDPNLAEALPVRDALFVVERGAAQVRADPPVALPGRRLLRPLPLGLEGRLRRPGSRRRARARPPRQERAHRPEGEGEPLPPVPHPGAGRRRRNFAESPG